MGEMPLACAQIVFIGGGKMGEAILGGWIDAVFGPAEGIEAGAISVVEVNADRRDYLSEKYGVSCFASAEEIGAAHIVVLAVKPQVMMDVLAGLRGLPAFSEALFISIAAGLATARLVAALPAASRLVRVMPNTPLLVGEGASALCASERSTDSDLELVCGLFACLGLAVIVDEEAMDAIGALSGCGPAYVAAMIESLTRAGVELGLDEQLVQSLAIQTAWGTMLLMKETGQSPQSVREAVTSPGGSTLAALSAMAESGMDEVYCSGVKAALRRSKELGAC
ncbi:MAG: pyrroline-5-carboxylate reductase [Eggerthellaceae bacterium]|nr:pyrroline-5-carboxylate reductase [Eggerthellaceae bacterium]